MPADKIMKKKLMDYIIQEHHKGYSLDSIKGMLIEHGHKKNIIDELIKKAPKEPHKRHAKKRLVVIMLILLVIAAIFAGVYFAGEFLSERCTSEQCFIQKANQCERSIYTVNDEGTIYEYKSHSDCTLTKAIKKVSDSEPDRIKQMFEKKKMECYYSKGNFNDKWVNTLLGNLDQCSGSLKEALYELIISQYQDELGV